ncbi:MAG: hypothetical protein ACFHX7_00300 [Pseudomonadota bacterium]
MQGWSAIALNTAPDSQNEIHGDQVARQYGFKGGLVPGVTISAYLAQPAVSTWGLAWLTGGAAHVRVSSPLYDGERFTVEITDSNDTRYNARLTRPDGTVSATAEVVLPAERPTPPVRRFDPVAAPGVIGPAASPEVFRQLQQSGCQAYRYRWNAEHRMSSYVQDATLMPELLQASHQGYANLSFLLGTSNWVLASNALMNPWVHLETRSQNFCAVPPDTLVVAEMNVVDFYEKKGHKFVDVEVNLFDDNSSECLAAIALRAIYQLRGL